MARYTANTDELPSQVAENLLKLIESSGIFDLKQSDVTPKISGPPDVFFYNLSLHNGINISLTFNDITVPAKVHPLLSLLRKLALEQPKK